MTNIITHNHTIDKSIQQLQDTTIRHQIAINTIQATLETQQQDIADIKTAIIDIRTSINHIIHAVSEFATKLGIQVTLPPPLPLSTSPPTLPPATIAGSMTTTTPSPTSHAPHFTTVVPNLLSTFHQTPCAPHQPITPSPFPSSHAATPPSPKSPVASAALTLLPTFQQTSRAPYQLFTNPPFEFISFFQTMPLMKEIKIASESLYESKLISGYDELNANYGHKMFDFMLELIEENIFGKALFVFDPGGISSKQSGWSASLVHILQLSQSSHGHSVVANRGGTTVRRNHVFNSSINSVGCSSPGISAKFVTAAGDPGGVFTVKSIHDLEDKVIFERMVMIRLSDTCITCYKLHALPAARPRRFLE